ncbi:MAG: hypothetical protein DRP66_05265 [Planctomycetota bacterium]|nr:MAG: hypothetical protein DRP66_05265 [Planctomycetota bacterium]
MYIEMVFTNLRRTLGLNEFEAFCFVFLFWIGDLGWKSTLYSGRLIFSRFAAILICPGGLYRQMQKLSGYLEKNNKD